MTNIQTVVKTIDAACAGFHRDMLRMMIHDDKGFVLYVLLLFLCCEVIHTCIVM